MNRGIPENGPQGVHPNAALIDGFYDALDRHDGAAMAACYRTDAVFSDPAFGELHGEEIGAMWRMLTARAERLDVELVERSADEESGSARWIARYPFTQTGREVTNDVRASFRFRDGLIAEHRDEFSFYRWSSQALGPVGRLLGWTPLLRKVTRRRARAQLQKFMAA